MTWGTLVTTVITVCAAILGVGYGAHLTRSGETLSWTREQRLKAYIELAGALEKCYESFTLIAASLDLANYDDSARADPKIIGTTAEWNKWMEEVDRCLPQAELVSSERFQTYLFTIRMGVRSRQEMLLMKLAHGQAIDQAEWERVASRTHKETFEIRWRFREDITYIDPQLTTISSMRRRLKIDRRRKIAWLAIGRSGKNRISPSDGSPWRMSRRS
jgi:hypothetical protein